MRRCFAIKKNLERCSNHPERGSIFCRSHRRWWIATLFGSIVVITTIGGNIAQMFGFTFSFPFNHAFVNTPSSVPFPTNSPSISSTPDITLTFEKSSTGTATLPPTLIPGLTCTENILSNPWRLEADGSADEKWVDFSDEYILQDKDVLRINYDLNGIVALEGERKNDSTIVFTQPHWYGVSLVNYGINGLDGEQTVDIPLSAFLELPNPDLNINGGKPLNLNEPVSSIRLRFWHHEDFVVDVLSIYICSFP